jgi:hypothetical protein
VEGPGVALDMDLVEMVLVKELKKFEKIAWATVLSWKKTWEEAMAKAQVSLPTKVSVPVNMVEEPTGVIIIKNPAKAKVVPQVLDMSEPMSTLLFLLYFLSLL